jgi:addiction module HigA family antidote
MPMKNPPHPGEVVRTEVLQPLGLSLTKAAEILGVRRATLSDLANGKTALSAEMALRLEKAFGVSMDLLLRMQAGYDAAQARRHAAEIDVRRYRLEPTTTTDT